MPDYTRPDRLGVVFSLDRHEPTRNPFEKLYIVGRAINGLDDFNHAAAAIEMFIDNGALPVWLSYKGEKKLVFPDFALADAIMRPVETPFQRLMLQALTWRKKLGID